MFATGTPGAGDPQAGMHKPFSSARVDHIVADGSVVRLGDLYLTAIATPGHTPGALSWHWGSCDGGNCRTIVYADSLSPVSRDDYRFSDHRGLSRRLSRQHRQDPPRRCEILLTPHPSASQLIDRMAGRAKLIDPDGCRNYADALTKRLDERLAKEQREISYRVTIPCTRAQGEAIADRRGPVRHQRRRRRSSSPTSPTRPRPDEWLIHAYFDAEPTDDELAVLSRLGDRRAGDRASRGHDRLGDEEPAGPAADPRRPLLRPYADALCGPARGRGQFRDRRRARLRHRPACDDRGLPRGARRACRDRNAIFANIADIGTGTGLLAFAALALWPQARCIATDIDPIAVDVSRENAAINAVKLGHGPGELLLAVADGMDSPMLVARAPFDLLIANILAGPLIELAPDFAKALAPGGTVILAGLLDTQADAVASRLSGARPRLLDRGSGEWPVLVLTAKALSSCPLSTHCSDGEAIPLADRSR